MKTQNIFKSKLSWNPHSLTMGFGSNPQTDWKIIFSFALFFILIGTAINIYVYIKIDKGEIFVVDNLNATNENIFSQKNLRETVNYYEGKKLMFEEIVNSKSDSKYADPSI